jgi:hypothetical protein
LIQPRIFVTFALRDSGETVATVTGRSLPSASEMTKTAARFLGHGSSGTSKLALSDEDNLGRSFGGAGGELMGQLPTLLAGIFLVGLGLRLELFVPLEKAT